MRVKVGNKGEFSIQLSSANIPYYSKFFLRIFPDVSCTFQTVTLYKKKKKKRTVDSIILCQEIVNVLDWFCTSQARLELTANSIRETSTKL